MKQPNTYARTPSQEQPRIKLLSQWQAKMLITIKDKKGALSSFFFNEGRRKSLINHMKRLL